MVGIESHSLCPEYFSTTYGGMFKNSKRSYSMPFIVESALNKRPSSQINCKHGLYNNHTHNQNICTQSLSLVAFSILWTASECCECVMYVSSTKVGFFLLSLISFVVVLIMGIFCNLPRGKPCASIYTRGCIGSSSRLQERSLNQPP